MQLVGQPSCQADKGSKVERAHFSRTRAELELKKSRPDEPKLFKFSPRAVFEP